MVLLISLCWIYIKFSYNMMWTWEKLVSLQKRSSKRVILVTFTMIFFLQQFDCKKLPFYHKILHLWYLWLRCKKLQHWLRKYLFLHLVFIFLDLHFVGCTAGPPHLLPPFLCANSLVRDFPNDHQFPLLLCIFQV